MSTCEFDALTTEDYQALRWRSDWRGLDDAVVQGIFGSHHEEGASLEKSHEPRHVNVVLVHDVKAACLQAQVIQKVASCTREPVI